MFTTSRSLLGAVVCVALSLSTVFAHGEEAWIPGTFDIRFFSVGQADSQLVIFPSGYTILMDVGERGWNSQGNAQAVYNKTMAVLGHTNIDVGVISHWHVDHLGYVGYGGFWRLIEDDLFSFGTIIDRDAGVWKGDVNNNGECDYEDIEWRNAGTFSGTGILWACYATNPENAKIYNVRQVAQMGSTTQINPPDQGATVTIVHTDAIGVVMADGITPVSGDHTQDAIQPSENDYCISIVIQYGNFKFYSGGDLDGSYSSSAFGYAYNDAESVAADYVGSVDVYRANHHGSFHSSNQYFMDVLNPQVSTISCGLDSQYGHPAQEPLDRMLAKGDVYLANFCDMSRSYGSSIITDGDIVLKSFDQGDTFSVHGKTYVSGRR